ncbi:IDEAL domain-containing protein [Bacillaceae bacterium Marseille-Q3522]|nr:IDEAL domain-containing protein [Bacillaceae bacterium Marseille-Q3522]
MKKKSYTELSKYVVMNQKKQHEVDVTKLYIDMLLLEISLKSEKEKLLKKIDQAIDSNNKERFYQLSSQYKALTKRFGT